MRTLRTVLLGTLFLLAAGAATTVEAVVSYDAILEWNGPYYRIINYPGIDQLVDDPVADIPFVQPYAVAAAEHAAPGGRDVLYVVDAGHSRVQAFEANASYLADNTFTWTPGAAGVNQYDDNQICLNEWANPATKWILPHSEVVVIDGVQWTWVADLTGFVAADKVYTITYTDASSAPEILLPANSLTSASTISLNYALTAYQGGGTAAPGLGDVDYGTSNGVAPVLTKIDGTSGGPLSFQVLRSVATTPNEAVATSDDVFLVDAADNSAGQNEELFYYTVTAAGAVTYREAYDDVVTQPYDAAVATGGTEVDAAAACANDLGPFDVAVTVVDKSQVTGHSYTVTVVGNAVTVTDATTGKVLITAADWTNDLPAACLAVPGLSLAKNGAVGVSNTITTTKEVVKRYAFLTDTGADRIKVITASDDTPAAPDDWLPGDYHNVVAQAAGGNAVGTDATEDFRVLSAATIPEDYTVWTNAYPIKEGTLATITFDPTGTPVVWNRVDDLGTAGPADRVYTVDWTSGKITFGDGVHGAKPPASTAFDYTYYTSPDAFHYGSSGTAPARFSSPRGIAARWNASLGVFDVYVADTGNNRIQKLAFHPADPLNNLPARMEFICQWNTANGTADVLNAPVDIAVMLDNQTAGTGQACYLAVADQGNDRVVVYKDTDAMSGGGTIAPAWDSSNGVQGNSLGKYMQVEGVTFLRNANDLDIYACDALRGTVTKYEEAPTPTIAVTNFSGTGTCYPPTSSFTFTFTTTNPPLGGTVDIYYDTASTFDANTAKLCVAAGTISATATSANWNIAQTPGGIPADGTAYYIYFRMKDANGATVASDQTTSSELFCIDSSLLATLKGTDEIDGDYTLYLQNGLSRVVDLQVAYPDSVIAVSFSGGFDPALITIGGIVPGTGWDVPDNANISTMFNQASDNTAGTYQVSTSVLGSQIGLVSAGPHTLAQLTVDTKVNAIDLTNRFKNGTLTILSATSGMKDIHGESPTQWRTQNVRLRLGYLGDIATSGVGADSILPHLAAKPDGKIDFEDQMTFTLGWNGLNSIQDRISDIGPTTGSVPDLLPMPDGVWSVDDILAFTVMYSWAAEQGFYRAAPGTQSLVHKAYAPRPQPMGGDVDGAAEVYTVSHFDQPKAGEVMTVDLMVNQVTNLTGALLNLAYNPASLELLSVENGGFLDGQSGSLFFHRAGDGWVEVSASRLDKKNPGVDGSGSVARLSFRILNEAAGDLDLRYDLRSAGGTVLTRGVRQLSPYSGGTAGFQLYSAHPNPVHGTTNIVFSVPTSGEVSLKVFDVSGRQVRNLMSGRQQSGYHVVSFDGRGEHGESLPAGVYFYRLQTTGQESTRKLILAK
jgi:hypothetical protein